MGAPIVHVSDVPPNDPMFSIGTLDPRRSHEWVGSFLGNVLNTDIRVFIDDVQIMGYNISGHTHVIVEDLTAYGFDVRWYEAERRLTVERGAGAASPRSVPENTEPSGSIAFPFVFTDIVTYAVGERLNSYNIQGSTVVRIDDLAAIFGEISWNGELRELRMTTN